MDSTDPHQFLNIQLEDLPPLSKAKVKERKIKNSVNPTKNSRKVEAQEKKNISEEEFLNLLSGSSLTASSRVKVKCPASANVVNGSSSLPMERVFEDLLNKLSANGDTSGRQNQMVGFIVIATIDTYFIF